MEPIIISNLEEQTCLNNYINGINTKAINYIE